MIMATTFAQYHWAACVLTSSINHIYSSVAKTVSAANYVSLDCRQLRRRGKGVHDHEEC